MAAPTSEPSKFLAPPVLEAIRNEDVAARVRMERSVSQEIREERADLKEAAEQSLNVIVDLDLDGIVRWVSPSWTEVVGTPVDAIRGTHISGVVLRGTDDAVFANAIAAMKEDDSKSQIIRFKVLLGPLSVLKRPSGEQAQHEDERPAEQAEQAEEGEVLTLEGQGMMVHDRASTGESHTMWHIRPASGPRAITIDLPDLVVESLGFGAEVLAKYLTELAETGSEDPQSHPAPPPILCRICERQIIPWWFEKHSELCLQEHKAEMEVQLAHEAMTEHRNLIVKVLDALEARKSRPATNDLSPIPPAMAEYKGMPIGQSSNSSSTSVSGRATPVSPNRSQELLIGAGHARARSFAVRRPLARIVELILDLCDTAIEIKTPMVSDNRTSVDGSFRTQTPGSENHIQQVHNWQAPGTTTLENEPGIALLAEDTESLAKAKIETVLRHRRILEYSERIRIEYHLLVQDCIEAAMRKAASIREGRVSSESSDSENEASDTPAPHATVFPMHAYDGASAMAEALRQVSDPSSSTELSDRRQSVAISTGSNSPIECPTPRSHSVTSGFVSRAQSVKKRHSLYGGSDANDSDASLSSSVLSQGRRTESPSQEHTLKRSQSSKERKRRSLKLPSMPSPRRQSPSRMGPPRSPLRLSKSRISIDPDLISSPVTSPQAAAADTTSPSVATQEPVGRDERECRQHRRQPSGSTGELRPPGSPRLSGISPPQQRAVAPSIKDFEIIKPISKGAFGSVYLSKKKTTGDYFAIKVLKKSDMVAKNQVTNVKAERAIMMWQGESDFVAKLYWTFSSKDYLYLVMEYLNGGDCASLVKVLGGLPEDWAKKYLAEVVLGVEHLHSRGIVHRDLKPDNLLIDQKGHLKLTDFGLSRMGLIGRQKRLAKSPHSSVPDLLKSGPFVRPLSMTSSRSTSFDFQGGNSPSNTPVMTPDLALAIGQPSYFSLGRDSGLLGREHSRRTSGYRSDSGSSETFSSMFRQLALIDEPSQREEPIEEEKHLLGGESPDQYLLQHSISNLSSQHTPPSQSGMLPPPMALFDPEDQNRRFVGTPDYLAPETIQGLGQDEMSDWWSTGCILFEFIYGYPPFHAATPEAVFANILARKIEWPADDETLVSDEARHLMMRLMTLDPKERMGSNLTEACASGGEEIRRHPWFDSIRWETLLEDEAQFVPAPENPEDTEYFDPRGATLQSFAEEVEDQSTSPAPTPGADYAERPHDALSRIRTQVNSMKRNLMPLHIPAHVRESRSRRLSEPAGADDFGSFAFKNLPVLEKANKDVIQKLRAEALQIGAKPSQPQPSTTGSPAVDASPLLPSPLKRTLSAHKSVIRPASPANLASAITNPSPNRVSQPTSPLLVQFSVGPAMERRKTSGASSTIPHPSGTSLPQPGGFVAPIPPLLTSVSLGSNTSSPMRSGRTTAALSVLSPERGLHPQRAPSNPASRHRSQTVGSQDGEAVGPKPLTHHKRKSQVVDVSPSSSDNEDPRAKALLRVQRRRQSSRRLSQFSVADGPCYRPLDVLICEDHPVSRLVMERLLEKLRCRTITVVNGPEAVRFATSEVQFDIIMMEVKLPQLNGHDVARMIRGTKNANTQTPIIAVTGYLTELPESHHFDALIEKPPTLEKLTAALCQLCQWKAPPADWHPELLHHTPSGLRQESHPSEGSPSSQSSGPFGRMPSASYRASSRDDSVASGSFFGDLDGAAAAAADSSVIITQPAGDDWAHGLGIMEDVVDAKPFVHPGLPHLLPYNSAPPLLDLTLPSPRKQRSSDAIRAKRETLEKRRHESAAESGDDEGDAEADDEPTTRGLTFASDDALFRPGRRRPSSPRKRSSKLGTQMMRTNSSGSVISGPEERGDVNEGDEDHSYHGGGAAAAMEALTLAQMTPRGPPDVQASLTPPEIFQRRAGEAVREIDMDATPRPSLSNASSQTTVVAEGKRALGEKAGSTRSP